MEDVLHQNYAVVTGGTAIAGPLTSGGTALRLSSSGSWVVADSVSSSLAVGDGVSGGCALEGWFRLPSLPSGTQTIMGKASSYELKATSAGFVHWIVTNSGNTATVVSSSAITANTWYHVAGVYNGDYTGTPIFGNQVQGSGLTSVPADYVAGAATGNNNLQVCKYTIPEKGQITSLVMDLKGSGGAYQDVAAVVYEDDNGAPSDLLAQSDSQRMGLDNIRRWVTFPLSCSVFSGDVWLGFVGGAIFSTVLSSMAIGYETSGSTRKVKSSPVSDGDPNTVINTADSPFGTAALSDSDKFAIYANYTPTGRTGAEGKAVLYLNGVESASVSYAHGIGDSANNLQHPAGAAVDLESWAIYNKKLTPVQVATHYSAR